MNTAISHRSPCLLGTDITSQLPSVLRRPAVLPLPRAGVATGAPSVAYHQSAAMTLRLREHGASPTVDALLTYANAVWEAGQELKGTAQRIVTAFQQLYIRAGGRRGISLVLGREFAHEFLLGERGHGLETDAEALDMRKAIEEIVNEGESLEDYREEEQGPGYPREWYPAVADAGEWMSDAGWLAICDGDAA